MPNAAKRAMIPRMVEGSWSFVRTMFMGLIGFGFLRFSLSRCGGVGKLITGVGSVVSVCDDAKLSVVIKNSYRHPCPPRKKSQRKKRNHQHQQFEARAPH